MTNRLRLIALLAAGLALSACAQQPVASGINDPYEAENRNTHAFNTRVDAALFRGGEGGPPGPVGQAVSNAGGNLGLPGKVVNSLLQGRPEPAIKNGFRFLINSTLGVGGLFDPAGSSFSLPETETDFGETLHVWGGPEGAYLEWPLLGPTTERDAMGTIVDSLINPLNLLERNERAAAFALRLGAQSVERKRFAATYDSVLHDSADSYAQTRLIYLQNRRHQLQGETEENDANAYDPYEDVYGQ